MTDPGPTSPTTPVTPPCVSCGYDLRGLPQDGVCPECGTAIERSLAGDRLIFADPAWLGRLRTGQALLAWGFNLPLTIVVIGFAARVAADILAGITSWGLRVLQAIDATLQWIMLAALLVGVALALAGAILLTEQDPRDLLREGRWSTRAIVRWGLGGTILAILARQAARTLPGVIAPTTLSIALVLAAGVASTVAAVSLLRHLARLASRVPDEELHGRTLKSARTIRWALPAAVILPVIESLPGAATTGGAGAAGRALEIVLGLGGCVSGLAGLVLLFQLFVVSSLMSGYRSMFRLCAAAATELQRVESGDDDEPVADPDDLSAPGRA